VSYTEIPAIGEVKTPCEICEGKRFKDEVLASSVLIEPPPDGVVRQYRT
jgi:excinuclease UvrABC ATPase subunit